MKTNSQFIPSFIFLWSLSVFVKIANSLIYLVLIDSVKHYRSLLNAGLGFESLPHRHKSPAISSPDSKKQFLSQQIPSFYYSDTAINQEHPQRHATRFCASGNAGKYLIYQTPSLGRADKMAKNDITGDDIKSKPANDNYRNNAFWEKVEKKKKKKRVISGAENSN